MKTTKHKRMLETKYRKEILKAHKIDTNKENLLFTHVSLLLKKGGMSSLEAGYLRCSIINCHQCHRVIIKDSLLINQSIVLHSINTNSHPPSVSIPHTYISFQNIDISLLQWIESFPG